MKQFTKSLFIVLSALFSFSFAFAETGTEVNPTSSTKNTQLDCKSFYIAGDFIPSGSGKQWGTMANSGLKLRSNQLSNTLTFTVNKPYTIKKIVLDGYANDAGVDTSVPGIKVTKVEVDGVETTFTGGEFPVSGDQTSAKLTIDNINAAETITLTFDNSNVTKTSQIVVSWSVDWERPDATQPTITVSPKALSLIPGGAAKVSAKVDPNTFTTVWASDKEAVATVAEDGTVTAVAAGVANIINRWDSDATVADTAVITVVDFDVAQYDIVKQFDFTTMGDVTLTIESEAAGKIWNAGNKVANDVFFCTNEGLEDIAVQAVLSGGKGWSITEAGLTLGSSAGRCAAIGHLKAGQVVEIIYTGSQFFTGSKEDATMKDDGAVKTALNEGIGRAIYKMEEDGMLGFEIGTGNAIEKIIVYEEPAAPLPEIVNANFEADEPIASKVCTYAKDVLEGQVANMQPVTGWTIVENGDARAAGTFAYGSTAILGGDGGNVPAVGPNGETEGKALGLEAVWSATTQYTQDVKLPAGEYLFEAVIFNAAGTGALATNLIGIDGNYLATKSYPVGKWTKDQIKFTLAEEKTVTVSLGVNSGNVGNGAAPHLFIDHVKLYGSEEIAAQELAAAKENALATIDALPIGDALFLYNEAAIQAAKADVNTAETIEAVNTAIAAARAAQNKPAADKEYVITNKTAQLALSITTEAVKIEKEGAVKFTEVEGGWVLSNTAETPEYIFKTTGNTWTLSTTTTKDEAYKVNFNLVDGAYTIQGANGLFGTDNATEGSAVYANKAQANNGLWTIAEKPAEPAFEPAYGTLWTEEQGSQVDENEFNYITLENKYFNGLVKEGDTIKVAISHVGNQPSSRARIITEGTLNLTIDNAGESKTIQQDMTSADLVLDADEIANIQNGANVVLSWKNMTVAQVDLVEKKAEIDPTLLEEAEGLASDASAVAVGKLLAAIEAYKKDGKAETLQDAMTQFKADNADQVADQTAKVATNGWKKFDGSNAGVCATQFAPAITTYDGRNAQLAESYEEGETAINRTGTIIYQDITGLTNGKYKVGFYGNAFFTSGRGFESPMEDGAEDVAYVFANEQKEFITARIATSTTENNFRQFDVEVTDGTIKLGMGKEKPGTNWHTMQIYQLTWFTTAKELFAAAQVELKASIEAAEALKTGNRTEGLDAFNDAIALAKQGVESNWYNITEIQSMISGLKDAMETFKVANYYKFDENLVAYVIDAESGKFMAAGHNYGTRGIVNETGLDLTFEAADDNKVFLNSRVSNGGNNQYLGDNLYMDATAYAWAFEYVSFGFYITNGTQYINLDAEDNLVMSDTPREWIIVTAEGVKEQRLAEMAEATPENPADATFLLQNPNFNRNDQRVAAWVVSDDCTNKNLNGGNNVNNCAESYHSTFTISQTITDAPKGTYELRAQGFYRQDNDATEDAPVFFINDKTTEVPVKTGEEGSMSAASESFTAGLYNCEPVAVFVENGTLTVGVKATGANQWVIFDNFRLTYYGSQNTVGISEVNNNVLNNVKTIYNLNGQKVQKAQKGLYIINGKKTVVK